MLADKRAAMRTRGDGLIVVEGTNLLVMCVGDLMIVHKTLIEFLHPFIGGELERGQETHTGRKIKLTCTAP
jgi:hypothetical protein